jgi:hypothetical protein
LSRRWAAWAVAIAVLVAVGAAVWLVWPGSPAEEPEEPSRVTPYAPSTAPAVAVPGEVEESWQARLFFPAASDRLVAQEAEVTSAPGARARATAVVATLLATAPAAPGVAVFPSEVKLGKLLLLEDGTAIVDLRTEPIAEPPQSGSTVEQLRIYAIVNSVLRNVEEVNRVVLLWNGVQRPSLAGHVDTGHPLRLRADLEAR